MHSNDDEVCTLVSVHDKEACGERSVTNIGTEWWRLVVVAFRPLYLSGEKLPVPSVRYGPGFLSRYSDSLQAGRSGDRIPLEATLSAPVQTGPGAHPATNTVGTGSFPGPKRPVVDHPTASSPEVNLLKPNDIYIYIYIYVVPQR